MARRRDIVRDAVSGDSGTVSLFDRNGELLREFDSGRRTMIFGVAIAADGSRIAAGGQGWIYAWDRQTGERLWEQRIGGPLDPVTHLDLTSRARPVSIHAHGPLFAELLRERASLHETRRLEEHVESQCRKRQSLMSMMARCVASGTRPG